MNGECLEQRTITVQFCMQNFFKIKQKFIKIQSKSNIGLVLRVDFKIEIHRFCKGLVFLAKKNKQACMESTPQKTEIKSDIKHFIQTPNCLKYSV